MLKWRVTSMARALPVSAGDLEAVAHVTAELSSAWGRLSGETRGFTRTQDAGRPAYAEFSFVIPMTVSQDASTFAVGVLIERGDAVTVAAAMFGEPVDDVSGADLGDACSEVCNIFSDSIARNLYPTETVVVGLPFQMNEANYGYVFEASGDRDIYQSHADGRILSVVVFTHSDPPDSDPKTLT